ncbi:MAG: hypothetical protein HOI23_20740 [Deltaproteobacteria bacterium]|nr:hypothetical protein [Deltaproteobacteria bacterium]MBT6491904.1 hypothetical protein [Deltaproteobacteria bacterium]
MLLQSKGFFDFREFKARLGQILVMTVLCLCVPTSVWAAGPRIVLLPNQMAGGPDVATVARTVLGPKLSDVAEVVPYGAFVKAGRKAGIRSGKMATAKAIKRVGKKLNIDLAFIVEGFVKVKRVGKKRRKRKRPQIRIALIQVATGKLLYTNTWSVVGNRLTPREAGKVIGGLKPQVQKHAPPKRASQQKNTISNLPVVPPAAVPEARASAPVPAPKKDEPSAFLRPVAEAEDDSPPPPPPTPKAKRRNVPAVSEVDTQPAPKVEADPWAVQNGGGSQASDPWAAGNSQDSSSSADPWATPKDADPWSTSQEQPPADPAKAASQEQSEQWAAQPNTGENSTWGDNEGLIASRRDESEQYGPAFRRALRFMVGAGAVRREAAIPDPNVEGQSSISYGLGGGMGSFTPGAVGSLDIYPLRFADIGGLLGGFGITVDFSFFPRSAYEADSQGNLSGEPITSNVLSLRGGLLWDFALWEDTTAPQIGVVAGFHYYTFPLDSASFPGVDYSGPYFGANFQLPMSESFQIVLGGDLTMPLMPGGGTSKLGTSGTGYGFGSNASMVYSLLPATGIPIEFELGGRYDSYNSKFEGQTSLGGNVEVLENAELRDVSWSGYFLVGFSL